MISRIVAVRASAQNEIMVKLTKNISAYTDSMSRLRSITIRQVSKMEKPGINSRFINCRRLTKPAAEMNKSPQVRPNVSTSVARSPELNVPEARAVGITLLSVDPMTPSKA